MPLNANQHTFVTLYRASQPRNATRAYEAVYKARGDAASVSASQLLRNPKIQQAIAALDAADLRDLGLTAAGLLRDVARLAFSDVRQLFDASGQLKPAHLLSDDMAAAVSSVEMTETMRPGPPGKPGEDAEPLVQRTSKVRLWNKVESQKLLAQYLRLLVEQVHVEHTGEVVLTWTERLTKAHTALEERRNGPGKPA